MTRTQTPLSLEYILLGFFIQSPIHGYDLYKKINGLEGISLVWRIKQSQLYALLSKLEEVGLLTSNIVPGEVQRMRKEFTITPVGRQTFIKWVTSPVNHGRDMRQEFLAKLYFAYKSGIEIFLELIGEQKTVCMEWLTGFHLSYSRMNDEQYYEKMILKYRISQIQAMIQWLDSCRKESHIFLSINNGENKLKKHTHC